MNSTLLTNEAGLVEIEGANDMLGLIDGFWVSDGWLEVDGPSEGREDIDGF